MEEEPDMRPRVVVADDHEDTVTSMALVLEEAGYEVRGVHSGLQALEAVAQFDPDAVVLDLQMPVLNGWEVARAIRAMPTGVRPLLIAISGRFVKGEDHVSTERAGFDHFCLKPCEPRVLLELLANLKRSGRR